MRHSTGVTCTIDGVKKIKQQCIRHNTSSVLYVKNADNFNLNVNDSDTWHIYTWTYTIVLPNYKM